MKKIEKLLQANNYLFFLLYILTFIASVIESIKYRGFIQKHLSIGFEVLFALTIISGVLTILHPLPKDNINRKIWTYFYQGQLFVFPLLFIFWVTLQFLNLINYPNYVFSKFHIIPQNLFTAIFTSFYLIIIEKIHTIQIGYKKTNAKENIKLLAFASFILVLLQVNIVTPLYIASELTYIIKNLNADYKDKMDKKWGREAYTYVHLIKVNTEENAKILIPPRNDPWAIEGNDHLMRGFLYPRTVISYKKGMDVSKFDYILLSAGLWKHFLPDNRRYQFPGFDIKASKTYIFDLEKGKIWRTKSGNFNFSDKIYEGKFGLIKR